MTVYVLPFEKMHGLGNDFIMLERRHLPNGVDERELAKYLCNRHYGIGADGIIIVDFSTTQEADFIWNYYNNDGSEAEMCGNGMRCFAKYVYERGFTDSNSFSVLTKAGIIIPTLEEDGTITVNMGKPRLVGPVLQKLSVNSKEIEYTFVEVGNPHFVCINDNEIGDELFFNLGPKIEKHKIFPSGINAEFVKIVNRSEIKVRVWERGVGPTLACGTGACASVVGANTRGLCNRTVEVHLPGGVLNIRWDERSENIYLNGTATFVYIGQLNLDPKLVCKTIVN